MNNTPPLRPRPEPLLPTKIHRVVPYANRFYRTDPFFTDTPSDDGGTVTKLKLKHNRERDPRKHKLELHCKEIWDGEIVLK
jgi:hypothetical protein